MLATNLHFIGAKLAKGGDTDKKSDSHPEYWGIQLLHLGTQIQNVFAEKTKNV